MVTTPLDMKYVYKRGRSLERRNTITESARIPDLSGNMSNDFYRYKVEAFTRDCVNYRDAVDLLETLYENDKFDLLESSTQKVINDVIPTVESAELPNCISYIESKNIGDINKDRLIETTKMYKSIDRIIKNHKNLSRRFEMNMKGKTDKEKCYKICEMVCTYDLSKFIKFNIALEELAYLGYMDGDRIPDKTIVEHVSNYFLMMDDNTFEDIKNYRGAIQASKVLSEGADESVPYLVGRSTRSNPWRNTLNEWKMNPDKDLDTLVELARDNLSSIDTLTQVLEYVEDFKKINNIDFDTMAIFTEANRAIDKDAAHNIMTIIKENNISNHDDLVSNIRMIWEAELNDEIYDDGTKGYETFTSDEIDKFKLHNLITDAQSAGEVIDQLEKTSMKESPIKIDKIVVGDSTYLDESNLVDHIDANGYLTIKLREYTYDGDINALHNILESAVACINNILYNSDSRAYYSIYENDFDICIRSKYKIILSEAQETVRGLSNSDRAIVQEIYNYTNSLDSIAESKIGFIMSAITDPAYAATVTPMEASLVFEMMAPYLAEGTVDEFVTMCKEEANTKYEAIRDSLSHVNEGEGFNPCADHDEIFDIVLKTMMLNEGVASNIKNAVSDVTKPFRKKDKNDAAAKPTGAVSSSSNKPKEFDNSTPKGLKNGKELDDKKSIEKMDPSDKESEEDVEGEKGEDQPGTGDDAKRAISTINDARLAWQGVKSKMKSASAKEQEMSRDLDLEFNHLLRTLKSTFGRDYREEIITGEVNHSLSKIIKIGIALAGAGIAAHTAVIPVIGAIALFAKSKHASTKEKKLILDEIDVELKVIDREINRAEASGSTKKYRQLLTIQRNMMRKRQEIYYSLAKHGKRVMPLDRGIKERE